MKLYFLFDLEKPKLDELGVEAVGGGGGLGSCFSAVTFWTVSLVPVAPGFSTRVAGLPPVWLRPSRLPARSSRLLFEVSWVLL
jgi:hypothetical protein